MDQDVEHFAADEVAAGAADVVGPARGLPNVRQPVLEIEISVCGSSMSPSVSQRLDCVIRPIARGLVRIRSQQVGGYNGGGMEVSV